MLAKSSSSGKVDESYVSALFFLSGATSLGYQTIWFRRFSMFWGSSTLSMAAVVSAFLVGLALGAYLFGRFAGRCHRPLRMYGLVELCIGAWALCVPFVIHWMTQSPILSITYVPDSPVILYLIRVVITFALIGPGCILMGGTLPLLIAQRSSAEPLGESTAWLYGINTLGAAFGCYVTGFHLLPHLGSVVTNLSMAGLNVLIGCFAWGLSSAFPLARESRPSDPHDVNAGTNTYRKLPSRGPLVPCAALLTGAAGLVLEMIWARQLAVTLGGSTYTFSATLCTLLLGIGIGGLIYHRISRPAAVHSEAWYLVSLAVFFICAASAIAQSTIPSLAEFAGATRLLRGSQVNNALVCFATAGILELLPAVGMGILFPAIVAANRDMVSGPSEIVGTLYFWNTLGAACAATLTFSVVVPRWGCSGAVLLAIGMYLLGLCFILFQYMKLRPLVLVAIVAGGGLAMGLIVATELPLKTNMGMYLYGPGAHNAKLLYFQEGASCNVLVTDMQDGTRSLRVNGKVDASNSGDQEMQLGCAYFSRFLRPYAKSVCVIGYGSGATAGASLLFPETRVTCCEIEPAVVEAGRWFASINHEPWKSDRLTIVYDDARNVLQASPARFDVIVSEPSNPWIAGVSNLYTKEFYEVIRNRLSAGGLFTQWVQTYNFTTSEFGMIVRTLRQVFSEVGLIRINSADSILVASTAPLQICRNDIDVAQRLVDMADEIRHDLNSIFGTSNIRTLLVAHFHLSKEELDELARASGRTINTDLNMRLEFDAPRHLFRSSISQNERIGEAIDNLLNAAWFDECVRHWGCTDAQTPALIKILAVLMKGTDRQKQHQMIDVCMRLDPGEPFFRMALQLLNGAADCGDGDAAPSDSTLASARSLGEALWQAGRLAESAQVFRAVTEWVPRSGIAWFGLARAYASLGDINNATAAFARAHENDPLNRDIVRERVHFETVHRQRVKASSAKTSRD